MKNAITLSILLGSISVMVQAQPGNPDLNFDADGRLTIDLGGSNEMAASVMMQPDGKIVAVGSTNQSSAQLVALRMNPDGSLDNTFGIGGVSRVDPLLPMVASLDGLLQPDGKIVQVCYGAVGPIIETVLVRYLPNGALDNSFGTNGMVNISIPQTYVVAFGLAIQTDGKILASGVYSDQSNSSTLLMRFNTDGSLDNTFSFDGIAFVTVGIGDNAGWDVTVQDDGKILVVGGADLAMMEQYMTIIRFNTDGILDNTFGTNGVVTLDIGDHLNLGMAVEQLEDGKILASGWGTFGGNEVMIVSRSLPNGSPDPSFGTNGISHCAFATGNARANSMVVQADGKVVLVGQVDNGIDSDFAMARYDTYGELDPTFSSDGRVTTDFGSGSDEIIDATIQENGLIVVAGAAYGNLDRDLGFARYISGVDIGIGEVETVVGSTLIFPNPILDSHTTLNFELKKGQRISVDLLGINGELVNRIMGEQTIEAGPHTKELTLPYGLSSGNYLLRLNTENGVVTVKLCIH